MHAPTNTAVLSQEEKGARFHQLHRGPAAFVLPNPWDIGSTRILTDPGFRALATTSAGCAFAAGRPDGGVGRDEMLDHIEQIVDATPLPVSADLEAGYGASPEEVGETIRLAAARGAVGGSIEDLLDREPGRDLIDIGLATERIAAAAEAAASLPFTFTLTARCESFLTARPDLEETIRRLRAYQAAGADVVYAPGLSRRVDIEAVTGSVDRPVNLVAGRMEGEPFTMTDLTAMGVRRVSLGSTLARLAYGSLIDAGRQLADRGDLGLAATAPAFGDINDLMAGR
jgi:2-methylisocitrate lyase-like PEP mutase family enzyme